MCQDIKYVITRANCYIYKNVAVCYNLLYVRFFVQLYLIIRIYSLYIKYSVLV